MIIGLAGLKQSGKSTTCNILHGIVLKGRGMISDYSIGKQGELLIKTPDLTEWSVFDITRKDEEFVRFAEKEMWPYVKSYSFADPLKTIATELFNIPHKNVYGTNKDKNQKIKHLKWCNMPTWRNSKLLDSMTAREFLQYLGTDIMRKIWEPVWCSGTINKIIKARLGRSKLMITLLVFIAYKHHQQPRILAKPRMVVAVVHHIRINRIKTGFVAPT